VLDFYAFLVVVGHPPIQYRKGTRLCALDAQRNAVRTGGDLEVSYSTVLYLKGCVIIRYCTVLYVRF